MEWVSSNSTNEGERYNNPAHWFIESDVVYNSEVYLGGYNIDKATAELCQKSLPFHPTMEHARTILVNTHRQDRSPSLAGEYIYFAPGGSSKIHSMQVTTEAWQARRPEKERDL